MMETESFVLLEKTLGQLLDEAAARNPDKEALIHYDKNVRWTWSELVHDVDRLAKGLMALGIKKGDKIGVWATNVPYWVPLMFASARIGAILVTVNTSYQEAELEYLLQQSDCETLFMIDMYRDHSFLDILFNIAPEIKGQQPGKLQVKKLPLLRRVVLFADKGGEGVYSINEVMELGESISEADYAAAKADVAPHDVVNMQYTSGTTGFPKGVMLSHVNILNNGYWIA